MIKHVVMWKFHDQAEGNNKKDNINKVQEILMALKDKIPELISIETGKDIGVGRNTFDLVLITTFNTIQDLDTYQNHPDHKQVAQFVGKVVSDRACVDFEMV